MAAHTTAAPLTPAMAKPALLKRSSSTFSSPKSPLRLSPTRSRTRSLSEEKLPHAERKLRARPWHHRSKEFADAFLEIARNLKIPSWSNPDVDPRSLTIEKVSGALTNDVFFITSPSTRPRTLLLRVYGPSSGNLISRPYELHVLHALSSHHGIGPKLYGTFENGRVEEHFDAVPLTPTCLRDRLISSWIGARMAELHSVDLDVVEPAMTATREVTTQHAREISVQRNVKSWLPPARDVLSLPAVPESIRNAFDLDAFEREWDSYMHWISKFEDVGGASKRVFSHNDTHSDNLLRLNNPPPGTSSHHQIIVVDFEYAGVNPAAFDIANHFQEWTADYHSSTPHLRDPSRYPNSEQKRNFYRAYLEYSQRLSPSRDGVIDKKLQWLDNQVRAWTPASHGMWAIWGLVQARETLENEGIECEFDYVGYALSRVEEFRSDIKDLGIQIGEPHT